MTETTVITPQPRTSLLPPFFVLVCLVFTGLLWGSLSQLVEVLRSEGVRPAGFQWGSDWLSMAKFIGSQAFFFLLILSSLAATFYRSSVFAGCGISVSLSYVVWLAFFKSSEHVFWWKQFHLQEKTMAACLLGLGAFFFIRWLALPAPAKGESPFLGGLLVGGIPCVILGPLLLIFFSHHDWLVFLRGMPLINVGLLGPMVGSALVRFAFLTFFWFLVPILTAFMAQLRWRITTPEEPVETPANSGLFIPSTVFYLVCLVSIFLIKVVVSAALSSSVQSVISVSFSISMVMPLPLSMVIFGMITPLFLLEWLLLFSLNESLNLKATTHGLSFNEKTIVLGIAVAGLIQTAVIFVSGLENGLEVFYLVSLTVVLLMTGQVLYRRPCQGPILDFDWNAHWGAYWEMNLLTGFFLLWVNVSLVALALAIGLDFVPLIPSLNLWSVNGLAEVMTNNMVAAFPPLILGISLFLVIGWSGFQSFLLFGLARLFTGPMKRAQERQNQAAQEKSPPP